jgi:hypothetical protein
MQLISEECVEVDRNRMGQKTLFFCPVSRTFVTNPVKKCYGLNVSTKTHVEIQYTLY